MWNNFEQSPLEDETISNAFSSRGIFRITSDEEVTQYPHVQASVQNTKMVIAIDKTVFLLEDEMIAKCSLLSFNTNIDVLAISQTGNLIVCGLSDGEIHGIFIKGIPLFSQNIKQTDINIIGGKTFAGIQQVGNNFCLTCTNGSVYCFSEIDESSLESYLNISLNENETMSFAENLYGDVSIKRLFGIRGLNEITAALLINQNIDFFNNEIPQQDPLLIAGTHNGIYMRSSQDDVVRINIAESYQGVKNIYNLENYIIILTNSGHLLEFCPFTKLLFYPSATQEILIDDLIVMECSDENIEFLTLTKHTEDRERCIKILDYPSLKCHNELDVTEHSWLVQQPKCSVNLYYFSCVQCNVNNFPSVLEMLSVSETHPSERFKKLIAKGHLEEAEVFGTQFELCLQPIYEAKAKKILVEMDSLGENNPDMVNERFIELMKLLQNIENKEFFRQHRMFNLPSRKILEKYLKEILTHLDEEDEEHILEIIEQLDRLKTLAIIDPYEINNEWQKFVYHPNLIKYITSLFKSDMPMACLIWKRHSSALVPQLTENKLRELLNLIPNDTKPFNLLQWLRQFVPIVSNTHPNIMPMITEWSIQKIRSLQYAEHWPEIGLEFSTKVTEIFEDMHFMHSDVRRQHERNIGKLRDVVNALEDLFVLKKSYNLIFTLDNYLQDSIDETAKCILLRVHLDNLKSLVNDFLYPIYQEKGSSPVAALRRYIALLVASRNSFSTWLERSVACIELLHNEDDRLESALLVLQNSPVPWPDTVAPLIKLRYSTHPLALKINTEYEIQVIKIMKAKYDWPTDVASDINLNLFMFRIVKMDLPDMLEDIKILTKAAPEISSAANSNCCYQMVKRGKLEMAYDFFKTLKADKNSKYAQEVTGFFAGLLECPLNPLSESQEEQQNFLEFYKLILPPNCVSTRKRLTAIENCFILRRKYDLPVMDVNQLVLRENRVKLLDAGIENIIKRSQGGDTICKYFTSEISILSSALSFGKMFGLKRLCQRMKCLMLSCALTYNVMEIADCNTDSKDDYIEMALELLVQQIQFTKGSQSSTLVTLLNDNDPLAFPLAYELLVRASLYENCQNCDLIELINYVRIASTTYTLNEIETFYEGREKEISKLICEAIDASEISVGDVTLNFSTVMNNSFDVKPEKPKKRYSVSLFDEVLPLPQQQQTQNKVTNSERLHIVKFVGRTLLFLVISTSSSNEFFKQLKDMLLKTADPTIEIDADSAKNDFFLSLEHLIKNKIHDVWYVMVQYLLDYQKRHNCKLINGDFISLQMVKVLRNIMSHKEVNFLELFVMLTADSYSKVLLEKLGTDLRTDQQKVNLLTLSEMYNIHFEEMASVEAIRNKRIKHYYYLEFCKQDPSIKGKFNAEIDSIEQLLKEFHNKQLDVHLLERMSRDFQLDYQKMLVTQVVSILQAQEMQYDIKTDGFGDEELVMITTVESIRSLCQPYINEIKNTDLLTSKLKQFIDEIHIYFYELYLCVIEILLHFDAVPKEMQVWSSILHFLKHKMTSRRRNRPGQLETDMWFESQKEIGVLPKISRYRLPFKPIVEQPLKDILDTELNVDNCESWFPLIQMHMMLKGSTDIAHNCDYFCMSAVKNSIGEYKNKDDTETWHLQPTNNAFLKSILRLVEHVHNPSKAFMILYFVSNYAPDGADQVEASYECYKFALKNEKLITDPKCQEQLLKIKRKYPTLKTQHLLYVYGLTDEKFMRLIENPPELIYHLYHSDVILKGGKLDINAVVKEIAELHQLDVEPIQFKLLQKWLSFTVDTPDGTMLDETLFEDQNLSENNTEEFNNAAENVIRANYIINSWPIDVAVQFLVANIFPPDGSVNTSKQLQMYECYFKLYDGSSTSFDNMFSQKQYITIKCVHELKKLGYNSSLEKFAESNKIDILKTIWQRKSHNPHTLQILANICLGFDIYLSKIWNGILKRMVMFNMVKDLNALVDLLSCKPQLLHTEGLIMAWDCVLLEPFKNANQTRSFEQEERLNKTLFRLQSCPVVHSLNLFRFAETCLRLDRPHMAAIFLAFCRNEEQKTQIKKLITVRNEKMRQDILDLEDVGILSFVLNFALKELNL
ncbi:kinetochore component rough deal isoform 2-T2 [Cochliomyia hominivorax]